MLPLVTEFSLSLPEFSQFLKILGGCDTPPHTPSSDAPGKTLSLTYQKSYTPLSVIMADILNVHLCASKLAFLAWLGREDSQFELQTYVKLQTFLQPLFLL